MSDAIAAISTAAVDGAISIIRVSGAGALSIADGAPNFNVGGKESHTTSYDHVHDQKHDELIDEMLVSVFCTPKTFTCEDTVEINCHDERFITRKILRPCLAHGTRLASPGEFTQRAFLNGRIDLTQTETMSDIVQADTDEGIRVALRNTRGNVRRLLGPLIQDLLNAIANIGVSIDYPEHNNVEQLSSDIIQPKAEERMVRIRQILGRVQDGQLLKEGIRTATVDKSNVGKGSLLNTLLEGEKAVVTDIAETTCDMVKGYIHLQGLTLDLIDAAGIRDAEDVVE